MKTLRNQVLLLCVGLVLITTLIILSSFWLNASQYTQNQIDQNIATAVDVFDQLLLDRENQLITNAELLTSDFGFKQAVATRDRPTLSSALFNHSARINADMMFLTDLDGAMLASTVAQLQQAEYFPYPDLIKTTAQQGGAVSFVRIVNDLYQVVLLPIRAPVPIAFAGVGIRLDETIAEEIKTLTHLDVTFLINGMQGQSVISTLADEDYQTALRASARLDDFFGLPFASQQRFVSRTSPLQGADKNLGITLLTTDLARAREESRRFMIEISIVAFSVLLLAMLGSLILARNLSTPLNRLVVTAQKIARGEYGSSLTTGSSTTEIKTLYDAFSSMGTDIQSREQRITYQAEHDMLTGLLNRVTLVERFNHQYTDTSHRAVLVSFNLIGFRKVNDIFGAATGDECLRKIAERLIQFRPVSENTLHARLSADHFVTVLSVSSLDDVQAACDELLDYLARPLPLDELNINLEFRAGYAVYPDQAVDAEQLIRRASNALDQARRDHHHLLAYIDGDDEKYLQRLNLVNDLKTALRLDNGQLFMCYQPKLDLRTNRITKLEALIRWAHPDQGFVSPDEFIALAEQSSLIAELTDWVILTVIRQRAAWQAGHPDLQVAINISARDVERENLMARVMALLSEHGLCSRHLCFEMTERDLMGDSQRALVLMRNYIDAGFDLSIDDYGIGQSSLSRLQQMPVTEIKIDKSFVTHLEKSEGDQIIVRSTIELGQGFNLRVIAEGVETQAAQTLLHQMGCDYIQGYFLARPLPADEIDSFINDFHRQSLQNTGP